MTALYIIAGILFLLLLVLLTPLHIIIRYEETLTVKLSVLFLRFPLYPKPKKIREKDFSKKAVAKKKQKAARKATKKKEKERQKPQKAPNRKKDALSAIKLLLRILKKCYPRLVRTFRIRVCELRAIIATDDAAKTAILYGSVAQVTAMLLELCERFLWCKRNKRRVEVVPDFCKAESSFYARICFTSCLYRLLCLAVTAGIAFLKAKLQNKKTVQTKGDPKNG